MKKLLSNRWFKENLYDNEESFNFNNEDEVMDLETVSEDDEDEYEDYESESLDE